MNFFERQKRAKRNSLLLIALFIGAVVVICFCVWYAVVGVFYDYPNVIELFYVADHDLTFKVLAATLIIIASGSLYKIWQIGKGGESVATALGGKLVPKNTTDKNEKMLLNIVEEISIASGISMPPVYILKDITINAFVAGYSTDDAVVAVTRGAVEFLDRNELQGVIAHEFSHIFNGDMKLNIHLVSILGGIVFISLIGESMLKALFYGRNNDRGNAQNILVMLVIGVLLYTIGLIGAFFANIIRAAINRQREYLADASAAQFTRYPQGLANALKKIGGFKSLLTSPNASEFGHFYFCKGANNFFFLDTHPPLDERIKTLEPRWDGNYIIPDILKKPHEQDKIKREKEQKAATFIATAAILKELNDIGTLNAEKLQLAAQKINAISPLLSNALNNPLDAQFVIYAMLFDKDKKIAKLQSDIVCTQLIETQNPQAAAVRFGEIQKALQSSGRENFLNIIQLAMPTLKAQSFSQYQSFKKTLESLAKADKKISWFEINIKHIVLYPLEIVFGERKIPRDIHTHIGAIKREVQTLLSLIAYTQFGSDTKAKAAYEECKKLFGVGTLEYVPFKEINMRAVESAYDEIQKAKPLIRKKIVEMSLFCLKSDGELSYEDLESVHALCTILHLPIAL